MSLKSQSPCRSPAWLRWVVGQVGWHALKGRATQPAGQERLRSPRLRLLLDRIRRRDAHRARLGGVQARFDLVALDLKGDAAGHLHAVLRLYEPAGLRVESGG